MSFKLNITIVLIALLLTNCLNFFGEEKEYEQNSDEAKNLIEWMIGIKLKPTQVITNTYAYKNATGIDPFYYARFTSDDEELFKYFDSTWASTSPSISSLKRYLSLIDKPIWYNPKIDSTLIFFEIKFVGGSKNIIYDKRNKTYYIYYVTA